MRRRTRTDFHWLIIGLFSLGIVGLATLPPSPTRAQTTQPPPPGVKPPLVLRIPFEDREDLQDLVARLDVWEVHHDEGYIVAMLSPAEQAWLAAEGRTVSVDPRSFHPDTIPGYPCYRTITELYDDLQAIHADHPDITELIDIGDSYEGRDIWTIRITNQATTATKPIFFLMANIHGRELITNEAAMVFVDYLADNYGVAPDVTWLLDHHEIHVSVSTNPDGHAKNEPGQPWAWWRKNANNNFCTGGKEGVDLNRNSTFDWNSCPPSWHCSSSDECSETYRGPSAGSEGETQAVENYVRSIFPDQRDDPLDAAAPLTTTGVFITLHSYSNLVLWPWGNTYNPAPNSAGLSALGQKMATYNSYAPQQSSDLYPTDGTTDDWAYGELGVASYTFEIGSYSDGFYPPCSRYDALIQPNISAFLYAAKVARAPYLTARGPDALNVAVSPAGALPGTLVTVTATVNDGDNGGEDVATAEFYLDTPPWAGGAPVPISPADGAFDEVIEPVVATLDTSGLSPGQHILFVRGQDATSYWGPFSATWLHISSQPDASFISSSPDWLGDTTVFTNTTTGVSPITCTWDFGDESPTVTDTHTTHVYTAPGHYTVTLTATNPAGSAAARADVEVHVASVMVEPATAAIAGDPGTSVTHTLRVTNTGTYTDSYWITTTGQTWATAVTPNPMPDLEPNAGTEVAVQVTVPPAAPSSEQDVATVTVTSRGDGVTSASTVLTTTVNAVYGVAMAPAADGQNGLAGKTVTYTLHVTNTGNITGPYSLSRLGSGWPTSFSPSGVFTLCPAARRQVGVYVTIPAAVTVSEQDVAVVQAAGTGVTNTSTLTTTAVLYQVFLPLVVRDYQ